MKKTLLALAVLGTVGAAHAQTAVVIDGSIDTAILNRAAATGAVTTTLNSSQRNTNYIGISGTEDIGGGLKGIFQIRTNFGSDAANVGAGTGSANIGDQNVWLGLQGGFGTVKLGRDLTPQFLQVSAYSTFGTGFLNNRNSMDSASTDARWNNAVQYVTPSLAGFGLQVMVAPRNENPAGVPAAGTQSTTNFPVVAGATYVGAGLGVPVSARLTYGAGPVSAGLAVTRNGASGPDNVFNLGGSYNLGVATLKAQFERNQNTVVGGVAAPGNRNAWLVAAEGGLPGTAIVLRAQYAKRNAATLITPVEKAFGVGADYNLSKRTVAYLYYGKQETPLSGGSNRDTVLGVRHAF
ncbi:MAG: porin [Paucimonas sp.]|nr:porin [Paucimonas sp.]